MRFVPLLTAFLCVAAPVAAEIRVIVERQEDTTALYIRVPAGQLQDLFGPPAEIFGPPEGGVLMEEFGEMGETVWTDPDTVFAAVEVERDGEPLTAEGISMIFQPPALILPFAEPWDATIAIAVCTVALPVDPVPLETLTLYTGYVVPSDLEGAPIDIRFPATGRLPLEVEVVEYGGETARPPRRITLVDGGTLVLFPEPYAMSVERVRQSGYMLGFVALMLVGLAISERRARSLKRHASDMHRVR